VVQCHVIFDDADPEPETHSLDEYDLPVPDVDKEEEGDTGTTDDQFRDGCWKQNDDK
jgi:hypothetical protein